MGRRRLLVIAAVIVVFVLAAVFVVRGGLVGGGKPVSLTLNVNGSTMTPDHPTVHQGDRVTITVTADKKEEIHLHGYDIAFEVDKPGGSVTKTFTADKTGDFDIEIEDTGKGLGSLTVKP